MQELFRAHPARPPLDGLKKRLDQAGLSACACRATVSCARRCAARSDARLKAKEWFERFPKQAYWTEIESWFERPGDLIEFTIRRLPAAD